MNQIDSNSEATPKGCELPAPNRQRSMASSRCLVLGTQFVQAVGWAMASAIRERHRIAAAGSATARRRNPTSTRRWCSPRRYRAPVVSNIVNNELAIPTFEGIARGGSGTFAGRCGGHGFGIRRSGWMGTTTWLCMRWRSGPSTEREQSRSDADPRRHLSGGRASTSGTTCSADRPKTDWKPGRSATR